MDKHTALITLITHCLSLTDGQKKELLLKIPRLSDREIDLLGRYFAAERDYALAHEAEILENARELIDSVTTPDIRKG